MHSRRIPQRRGILAALLFFVTLVVWCAPAQAGETLLTRLDGKWICDATRTLALQKISGLTLQEEQRLIDALNKIILRFDTASMNMVVSTPSGSESLAFSCADDSADNALTLKTSKAAFRCVFTAGGDLHFSEVGSDKVMAFTRIE